MLGRIGSKFGFQVRHLNPNATLATDKKNVIQAYFAISFKKGQ